MEELRVRYQHLVQASNQLEKALAMFRKAAAAGEQRVFSDEEQTVLFMYRDSVIKRFELCYELLWKYCKLLLDRGYTIEAKSPRAVFRACEQQGIFTIAEVESLLHIVNMRNETAHVYDAAMAERASLKISEHYQILVAAIRTCGLIA